VARRDLLAGNVQRPKVRREVARASKEITIEINKRHLESQDVFAGVARDLQVGNCEIRGVE
jgi:hypothetical protein